MDVNASNSTVINVVKTESEENQKSRYPGGVKFLILSGIATIAVGCLTTAISKKRAREYLSLHGHEIKDPPISGTMLGLKALLYATVLTLGVFSIPIFGFCKYYNIKNMEDLRTTIRSFRKITPPDPSERTEFESVSDFLTYINERYGKPGNKKS